LNTLEAQRLLKNRLDKLAMALVERQNLFLIIISKISKQLKFKSKNALKNEEPEGEAIVQHRNLYTSLSQWYRFFPSSHPGVAGSSNGKPKNA
jgi:hypothetical protein